jgi:hypothetical protein
MNMKNEMNKCGKSGAWTRKNDAWTRKNEMKLALLDWICKW